MVSNPDFYQSRKPSTQKLYCAIPTYMAINGVLGVEYYVLRGWGSIDREWLA